MTRELSLFERKTTNLCYCVAGGMASCSHCRERRKAVQAQAQPIPEHKSEITPFMAYVRDNKSEVIKNLSNIIPGKLVWIPKEDMKINGHKADLLIWHDININEGDA